MEDNQIVELKFPGGIEYRLTYNFNHIVEAEEKARVNLLQAIQRPEHMSAAQTRALLYAALLEKHRKDNTSLEEAGLILSKHTAEATDALAVVYDFTSPEGQLSFTDQKLLGAGCWALLTGDTPIANQLREQLRPVLAASRKSLGLPEVEPEPEKTE